MFELEISMYTVDEAMADKFESAAIEEIGQVREDLTKLFCGYFRRPRIGTTLLPTPPMGTSEYLRLTIVSTPGTHPDRVAANDSMLGVGGRASSVGTVRTERVPFDRFSEGVIRGHEWRPDTLLHFGILRFKIPAVRTEAFEADVRRELSMILANEPGTMSWGYVRRPDGAQGVFPAPVEGVVEYLHLLSYRDEPSRQFHSYMEHRGERDRGGPYFTFDGDWAWGTAYRSHLASPYESEFFRSDTFIVGTSQEFVWSDSAENI